MTGPMRPDLACDLADDLAGAFALGALDPNETDAVAAHLESCEQPHAELRAALGVGSVLEASLQPIRPSAGLRDRVMTSIGARPAAEPIREPWYRRAWVPRAAAGLAAAVALGAVVWNVQLSGELNRREAQLREVAAALALGAPTIPVEGTAGGGVLVARSHLPILVADVQPPAEGQLYEMWLIDEAGVPISVGTFVPRSDTDVVIVLLDRGLSGFTTFAVTAERERVEAPTGDPVLVAPLSS